MKNLLLVITLLLALLLIPTAAFAGEKTTVSGKKPATASAKKGKVKCNLANIEITTTDEFGETVTIKNPIPDNLSDKCYCEAVDKKHINYKTASPTINSDVYFYMKDLHERQGV